MALYVDYLSLYTEYSVCSVHYYRDPASYEADYLAFTFLFTRAGQAYQDAVHGMFRSDSFTDAYAAADGDLEELEELDGASGAEQVAEEMGDLLFAAVNLARHHKVDAEAALMAANRKFERRFRAMEAMVGERFAGLPLDKKEALWRAVKNTE